MRWMPPATPALADTAQIGDDENSRNTTRHHLYSGTYVAGPEQSALIGRRRKVEGIDEHDSCRRPWISFGR